MATTANDIALEFAKIYAANLRNNVPCNSTMAAEQSVVILCDGASLLRSRQSAECANAIMTNSPDQTLICNPCSVINSRQNIIFNATIQCGIVINDTTIAQMRQYVVSKLSDDVSGAYGASGNRNTLDIFNRIANTITDSAFAASITQRLLAAQNITVTTNKGVMVGVSQNTVVEVVLTSMLTIPEIRYLADSLSKKPQPLPQLVTGESDNTMETPPPPATPIINGWVWVILLLLIICVFIVIMAIKSNDSNKVLLESLPYKV